MNEIGEIENTLNWWRAAGADTLVADAPRSWLKAPTRPGATAAPKKPSEPPKLSAPLAIPGDLTALRKWLLETDTIALPPGKRFDAEGDPAANLMVVIAMPEAEDEAADALLSGEAGLLFDKMLAAIGRDRASIYLVPLCPVRLPGGSFDANLLDQLSDIATKHVGLAAPKRLVAMGDAPSRGFCGAGLAEARTLQPNFNHDGGIVPVTATFHPRFLLQHPGFKAESWKDLQSLIEGQIA